MIVFSWNIGDLSVAHPEDDFQSSDDALAHPRRIFDAQTRRLIRVFRRPRRPLSGSAGETAGREPGGRFEFRDHARYSPGDDLRHLDWSLYARQGELHIKRYDGAEPACTRILIDNSASMSLGLSPKYMLARRLAAAEAAASLNDSARRISLEILVGRRTNLLASGGPADFLSRVFHQLETLAEPAGIAVWPRPGELCADTSPRQRIVLISDFADPLIDPVKLSQMSRAATEFSFLQIYSPEEVEPDVAGVIEVTDIETGEMLRHVNGRVVVDKYRQLVLESFRDLEREVKRIGAAYCLLRADRPLAEHLARLASTGFGR